MIPKVIHYCWFGKAPLPPLAQKCIKSWKHFLPEYEIKLWNEENFDVNAIPYTRQAYQAKKFAFVSDYARFWVLYHYGGLYFDTDVEVIKPINDIVEQGPFMGFENMISREGERIIPTLGVNPGLGLGTTPGLTLYRDLLDMYEKLQFETLNNKQNLVTIVVYTTRLLSEYGLKMENTIQKVADCWIYPTEYFCPIDYATKECRITQNTRSIHHYSESWKSPKKLLKEKIQKIIGEKNVLRIIRLKMFLCNG